MFQCKYYAIICSTTLPLALIIERFERELRKESLREGKGTETEERERERRKKKGLGTKLSFED